MAKKDDSTKTAIMNAASQLFRKYGFDHIRMDDVASAIHKKRTTVYIYFKNKEDLFFSIVQREVDVFYKELMEELATEETATKKLKLFFLFKFRFIKREAADFVMLSPEVHESPRLLYALREKHEDRQYNLLREMIDLGIEQHIFRAVDEPELTNMIWILISAMRGITAQYCLGKLKSEPEKIAGMLYAMLFNNSLLLPKSPLA